MVPNCPWYLIVRAPPMTSLTTHHAIAPHTSDRGGILGSSQHLNPHKRYTEVQLTPRDSAGSLNGFFSWNLMCLIHLDAFGIISYVRIQFHFGTTVRSKISLYLLSRNLRRGSSTHPIIRRRHGSRWYTSFVCWNNTISMLHCRVLYFYPHEIVNF